MKINYPIKYATMPIIKQVGWSQGLNELERKYGIICYITSKCYLLEESIKYQENGTTKKQYEVCFPYQNKIYDEYERETPSFNIYNQKCTNSNYVDFVFDSYEDAKTHTKLMNKKICEKNWINLPYDEDYKEKKKNIIKSFSKKCAYYELLEKQIALQTADIKESSNKVLDKLICVNNDNSKVTLSNLYEFLKFYPSNEFEIFSITKEEYEILNEIVKQNKKINMTTLIDNKQPLLFHEKNESTVSFIKDSNEIYTIDSDDDNLKLKKNEKMPLVSKNIFTDTMDDCNFYFTTETKEDILDSYKMNKNINIENIQGPILIKKL